MVTSPKYNNSMTIGWCIHLEVFFITIGYIIVLGILKLWGYPITTDMFNFVGSIIWLNLSIITFKLSIWGLGGCTSGVSG